MKKILSFIALAILALSAISCEPQEKLPKTVDLFVQLMYDGAKLEVEGVDVNLVDAAGAVTLEAVTDASGLAAFNVAPGSYTASATYKVAEDGIRAVYNGSANSVYVAAGTEPVNASIALNRSESQQIIIKELYVGGCPQNEGSTAYSNDAYVILYNNSDMEADATDIQFTFAAPYNANGTNKYITDGKLLYEDLDWMPAYGAIWWFTSPVKIPAYSQIVVAFYGAINHTATVNASVDLSNPSYYWMSNSGITQYTNAKYAVSDGIPASNYLTCSPFTQGNAWALSNQCPAFYIGRATKEEGKALSTNTDAFDRTLGTNAAMAVVKYPKANIVDAVEVWSAANISKSQQRFPASINTGYVALTNKLGYSVYRNVDKEATEALAENAGKLVYNYAGGTTDAEGSTDPSTIDAEASIAAGAHIIYSDTNDSSKDFHQRKVASLKK